jgi:hypothetical protein
MTISHVLGKAIPFSLAFFAVFAQGQAALRKGTYDEDCSGYTFHLPQSHSMSREELTLRLRWSGGLYPPAWESNGWNAVTAKRCSSRSSGCEDAADAKIRFEKIGRRIVGGFAVEFPNGRQEGRFKVKYHHEGPRMICE